MLYPERNVRKVLLQYKKSGSLTMLMTTIESGINDCRERNSDEVGLFLSTFLSRKTLAENATLTDLKKLLIMAKAM